MYKLTRPDGYDFYSGTINYRDAIGSIIRVTDYDPPKTGLCGKGLHACRNSDDCFVGAEIPCSAFRVEGREKLAGDGKKCRYKGLKIIEEIADLDTFFDWNYSEAINPINPFKIDPPEVTNRHIELLRKWASVRASVKYSVGNSVGASVRASNSVWDFVGTSVWGTMWDRKWFFVKDSVWGYAGSLFPNIKKWKCIKHKIGVYPFQPVVDLWREGLIPSFDGVTWRLHCGPDGRICYEENEREL